MTPDLFAAGEQPAKKSRARKPAETPPPSEQLTPDDPQSFVPVEPQAEVLPPEGESTAVSVDVVAGNPDAAKLILLNSEKFDQFYERVKEEVNEVADVSTPSGRERVRALAFKVTKTKTAIDKSAKQLTEGWRQQTAAVNTTRRVMVERLEKLADETRRPLTEWEAAEDKRKDDCRAAVQWFIDAAIIRHGETAAQVDKRGVEVWERAIDPEVFREFEDEAKAAKAAAVNALVAGRDRLLKEEADAAELEALRAERAAREAREAEEARQREEAERVERERREAEEAAQRAREAEEQRRRDEEARIAREREEAAAAAAEAARQEAQRKADEAVQAERERAAAAEAEAQRLRDEAAEREREQAEAEAQRQAAAEAAAAEAAEAARVQAAREKNRQHRGRIMGEAKAAILTVDGVTEAQAKAIVVAIVAGTVPHTTITF